MNSLKRVARRFVLTLQPGKDRWDVKCGTDPGAALIDLTPKPATIAALVAIPAPKAPKARTQGEMVVYQVSATIVSVHLESDADYHLVLRDDNGTTMIAEIPDPAFVGAGSPWKKQINGARYYGEQIFGNVVSATPVLVNKPATVVGVCLFDHLHGQAGVAKNGVELHPVLSITSP